jgi:acyl-CoA synthetase (AMP-forming)/AMP-acid ligase II
MANQLFKTDAKFILTQSAYAERILDAAKGCNIPAKNVFIFNHGPEEIPSTMQSWETLLRHGEGEWETFEGSEIASSTIAAYVMSSGTTGLPKAGTVSHANILAEITLAYDAEFKDFPVRNKWRNY